MDLDLINCNYQSLLEEVLKLRQAIRTHRDQRGDDRCFLDDETLYQSLPEGYTPPAREVAVELENCKRFLECRRNPATEYVSPQREIERLQSEVDKLQQANQRYRMVDLPQQTLEILVRASYKEGAITLGRAAELLGCDILTLKRKGWKSFDGE